MVETTLIYQGQLRCEATHGPSGTTLVTDAPKDNHGLAQSFSPTDLVATALGSCMLTIMGIAARTHGISIDGATAKVEKEMVTKPERRIGALKVTLHMPAGVSEAHRRSLEHAAHQCPVHKSMHPDIAMPITFIWE